MENFQDSIQDYIKGRLTGTDKQTFESQITDDADLAHQIRLFKDLETVGQHRALFDLRQTIQEVIAETPIQPDRGSTRWDIWSLAILAIGVLVGYWWWSSGAVQRQAQDVAKQVIVEAYDNIFNFENTDNSDLAQAVRAYLRKNYVEALPLFEKHVKNNPDDTDAQFYQGLCLVLTQKYEAAIQPLQQVVNYNSRLAMDARWYLALCYLHLGNVEEAKPLLTAIPSDSLFGEKAQEVLKKLGKDK